MSNKKSFNRLLEAVQKAKETSSFKESSEATYYPEVDSAGSGFAVIRFLQAQNDEDVPFVKLYNHGFKGSSGRWYIENCGTTIGKPCPVCEGNGVLWSSGVEADKEVARARKRKLSYYANILVVQDPKNPENEGKTFLFRFGKKIFDKITDCIQPEFPDDEPVNPFDLEEGANFKLKIRRVEGYANVDKSEFEKASSVDVEWDDIKGNLYDLNQLVTEDKFKSYEELKTKYNGIIGESNDMDDLPKSTSRKVEKTEEDDDTPAPKKESKPAKTAPKKEEATESEEDDLDYFRKLAESED